MSEGLVNEPWLIAELDKFVRNEHIAERVLAETRQRQIAAELGQDRRAINGLGRPRMEVDNYSLHYWGSRLGYGCWRDPQFIREFERDNPACRVKSTGTKLQVGYGSLSSGGKKKFTKVYA